MDISCFDYELPEELVAQHPVPRGRSRLMVVTRNTGEISHHVFSDVPKLIQPDELTVLNNSRVIPARLFARKKSGGAIEVLLLREISDGIWDVLLRPARRLGPGDTLVFEHGLLEGVLLGKADGPVRRLRFTAGVDVKAWARAKGQTPLPPYIKRSVGGEARDRNAYQTVYSEVEGSVAAPTAGLHFSDELLGQIKHEFLTLHVGYGTFQPVRVRDIRKHTMHTEYFEVSQQAAESINRHLQRGGKLLAVGTTTTRVLESLFQRHGRITAGSGSTDLFIYPEFRFRAVHALITNFHLPRSTLLMLVAAFAGTDLIRRCYDEAICAGYRFYSYGDAMLIR